MPRQYIKKSSTEFKSARVRKLLLAGELSPKQIAQAVPCDVSYVYTVRHRMKGSDPLPPSSLPVIPVLPVLHVDTLWSGIRTWIQTLWVRLTMPTSK
jgi:hypothetical protein